MAAWQFVPWQRKLPAGLRSALCACDSLVGPEALRLFYALYDPETGGFITA